MISANNTCKQQEFISRKAHISFIVNLTETMLESAKIEDWDNLTDVELERRQHLDQFFKEPALPDDAVWVKPAIVRILNLDSQIILLSEKSKQSLAAKSKHLSNGKAAARAYSQR